MSELVVVNEQEVLGKQFKVYGTIENPLFLAKDVAEWIEYDTDKVGQMINSVDDDEKLTTTIKWSGQYRNMWFLTENGLYEVLMLSRKPIAKEFKKQVKVILKTLRTTGKMEIKNFKSEKELEVLEMQVATERANLLTRLADKYEGKLKTYGQILDAYATKELTGEFLLPLPKVEKKTLSATEIGKLLDITPNKVGKLAKENNLKTEKYGEWVKDKSAYSSKEVETFRYYEDAVSVFKELIG